MDFMFFHPHETAGTLFRVGVSIWGVALAIPLIAHMRRKFVAARHRGRGPGPWCANCGYSMYLSARPTCPECGRRALGAGLVQPIGVSMSWGSRRAVWTGVTITVWVGAVFVVGAVVERSRGRSYAGFGATSETRTFHISTSNAKLTLSARRGYRIDNTGAFTIHGSASDYSQMMSGRIVSFHAVNSGSVSYLGFIEYGGWTRPERLDEQDRVPTTPNSIAANWCNGATPGPDDLQVAEEILEFFRTGRGEKVEHSESLPLSAGPMFIESRLVEAGIVALLGGIGLTLRFRDRWLRRLRLPKPRC